MKGGIMKPLVRLGQKPNLRSPTHGFSVRVAESHEALQLAVDEEVTNKLGVVQNRSGVKTGERKTPALPADLPRTTEMHPELSHLIEAWPCLPSHIRQTINTLVKSVE